MDKIMRENEQILKRLQDSRSNYNVYDWESERKEAIVRVKQVCKFKPMLLQTERRKKLRRPRKVNHLDTSTEPNRALFDLYQQSVREQNEESVQDPREGLKSAGCADVHLPKLQNGAPMSHDDFKKLTEGYQTAINFSKERQESSALTRKTAQT